MKNIQKLIAIVLVIFSIVSCQKDQEFNTSAKVPQTAKAIVSANHTHTGRKCNSKAHTEQRMLDPIYRTQREQILSKFNRNLQKSVSRSACTSPTILPVAVHYQGVSSSDRACLVSAAQEAIAVLNADFQAKNSDIVQWDNTASKYYPNISKGAACIAFQLATKNHPSGFGISEGDVAVTINKTNGDASNQWSGYINIFVGDAEGSLGYAPLGGSGQGDGMMISKSAFTLGRSCGDVQGIAPNNLGRTLTHEMGHYLNLDHLWGDGGCNSDDGVADTPNQSEENYGCPTLGATKGCTAEALHMSFMDYPDDACMYMFSAGQARRAEAWVNSGLYDNLKKNVLGAATGNNNGDTAGNDNTPPTDTNEEAGNTTPEEETEEEVPTEEEGTITMKVTLDDFGSETTFYILDNEYYVIAEYGPFADGQAGQVITESIDLPSGVYTFLIEDAYGDGICCTEGDGRWQLLNNGRVIESSNGEFGYWEEVDFAVGNARLKAPATIKRDQKDLTKLQPKVAVARK